MKTSTKTAGNFYNDKIGNPKGHPLQKTNLCMTTWETDPKKRKGSVISFLMPNQFSGDLMPGDMIITKVAKHQLTPEKVKGYKIIPATYELRTTGWKILDILDKKEPVTLNLHHQFRCIADYILIETQKL